MKNLLCTILLLSACFFTQAQDDDAATIPLEERQNEVRLNGLYLVAGAFEGSYSYILNDESSVGVSVFLPFDDEIRDDIKYYISPYYRFFFGKKPAAGFFLEGFGMLNSYVEEEFFGFDVPTVEENITDFALGIGLGGKFMTQRGLVGEVNLGIGRNLFNSKSNDFGNEIVGKVGISIGYRF
ncbi:MAG: DUF3575 domain-containing protein [Flavobacteriaceae bacterium]|nr:MAG: DUF3575 domain-containing protein [Flavobacteriaceae bacterium]